MSARLKIFADPVKASMPEPKDNDPERDLLPNGKNLAVPVQSNPQTVLDTYVLLGASNKILYKNPFIGQCISLNKPAN